jgi:hypothetical protein
MAPIKTPRTGPPSTSASTTWINAAYGSSANTGSMSAPITSASTTWSNSSSGLAVGSCPSAGQWTNAVGNNIGNVMHVEGDVEINGNLTISGKIYIKDEYGNILVCSDIKRERSLMIAMIKWSRENQERDPNECFNDPQFCFWVEKAGKYVEKLSKIKTVQDYDEETLILEAMFDLPKEIVKLLHQA